MAVYVDSAKNPYGRMRMSHMVADSVAELLEMADRIGLDRRHFQASSHPHFDVSQEYRAKAVHSGAVEVDRKGLVRVMQRHRAAMRSDPTEMRAVKDAHAASDRARRGG